MQGRIHSIQSLGTVDGPGVRSVVFMQGCPLRCGYCHNPDTWDPKGGELQEASAVFSQIARFRPYFGTEGGITVSGGEPLLQAEFVTELFRLCKSNQLHTALDTSGCIWNSAVAELLTATDLVLLDIKMTTDAEYRQNIGCSLEQPLFFLNMLENKQIPVWIRHVIVPGLTDLPENLQRLHALIDHFSCIQKVEFLPFRKICLTKYQTMQIPFPFEAYPAAKTELVEQLQKEFENSTLHSESGNSVH
ncbi:MAG: pyruvate formate-lyase-activating protein [Candidatus Merdivicinus sp.]|jgi:pyruvate formate lyase activating enzyme